MGNTSGKYFVSSHWTWIICSYDLDRKPAKTSDLHHQLGRMMEVGLRCDEHGIGIAVMIVVRVAEGRNGKGYEMRHVIRALPLDTLHRTRNAQ